MTGVVNHAISKGESHATHGRTRRHFCNDFGSRWILNVEKRGFCEILPYNFGFDGEPNVNTACKYVLVGEPFARTEQLFGRQTVDDVLLRGHVHSSIVLVAAEWTTRSRQYNGLRMSVTRACVRKPRANKLRASTAISDAANDDWRR